MVYQCHAFQGRAHEGRRPPDPTPHRGDRGLGANTPDQWVSGSLERPVPGRQAQGTRLWPDHHDSHRDLPARRQTRLLETQPACRALTHLEFNRATNTAPTTATTPSSIRTRKASSSTTPMANPKPSSSVSTKLPTPSANIKAPTTPSPTK